MNRPFDAIILGLGSMDSAAPYHLAMRDSAVVAGSPRTRGC